VLAARGLAHVGTDREVDLGDASAVEAFAAAEPFTHVINCAAYTQVDQCESHEAEARRANADGPAHLARAARARDAIAVHVSTDYVFDGTEREPYPEDHPTGPVSAYGRTKLEGEQRFLAELPSSGYVVRTSWLFGPGGPNFVATMLRLFRERPEVRVVDDQVGRPTYAPDLAAALVALIERRPRTGIYHFANAGHVSWFGLASAIRDEAAARGHRFDVALRPITTAEYPTAARRPAWSVLATAKLEAVLGTAPRPWREALIDHLQAVLP
jgi:dTDP-4-dehydrorhamnose reductase